MATRIRPRRRGAVVIFFVACLLALAVVTVFAVSRSTSASGDVSTVGGGAFGESVDVGTLLGGQIKSGPTPVVELPPGGGGPFTDQLADVDVPGLLGIALLEVSTEGSAGPTGFVESSAGVTTLSLAGGAVSADVIKSDCRADASGATASTTLTNLRVAGVPVADLDPPANTRIDVPAVGSLILNEQVEGTDDSGSGIVVNAVHLKLNGPLGTGDVIIAQCRCQAGGPSVVIPVGAIGGIGLAALLGAAFVWKLTRRPRPSGVTA